MTNRKLFIGIVNRGKAEEVLTALRSLGATGGTVFLGEGTAGNRILDFLGLGETEKEIFMIPIPGELEKGMHRAVSENFLFNRKNRGIAFSVPLVSDNANEGMRPDSDQFAYHALTVILERGEGKECVDAANDLGISGGTIFHGRGGGVPEKYLFPITFDPEKDVVMIVCRTEKLDALIAHLNRVLNLEETGSGIVFALPCSETTGIFDREESVE